MIGRINTSCISRARYAAGEPGQAVKVEDEERWERGFGWCITRTHTHTYTAGNPRSNCFPAQPQSIEERHGIDAFWSFGCLKDTTVSPSAPHNPTHCAITTVDLLWLIAFEFGLQLCTGDIGIAPRRCDVNGS